MRREGDTRLAMRPVSRVIVLLATIGALVASQALTPAVASAGVFSYTGAEQTYTVPAGVTAVHIVAIGAPGVSGFFPVDAGGLGAVVSADLPLAQDITTLYIEVGGNIFGGGGWGDVGGGGASDVRFVPMAQVGSVNSRAVVAGGGGGSVYGGAAGGNAGADGGGSPGGKAGTAGGGGAGGSGTGQGCSGGSSGSLGQGGSGGISLDYNGPGGGGGYYGGGGGGLDCSTYPPSMGGGGGGSSYVSPYASNAAVGLDSARTPQVTITAPVPAATGLPSFTGGVVVGDMLTVAHGPWTNPQGFSTTGYGYQWLRCAAPGALAGCAVIPGATSQTYTLAPADLGLTIRVQEAASNFYGTGAAAASASSAVIGEAPQAQTTPTISGAAVEGQVLTEAHGTWTDNPSGWGIEWQRCNAAAAGCAAIAGATSQTYTLGAADVGAAIKAVEVASNSYGASTPAMSDPTSVVQVPAPSCGSVTASAPLAGSSLTVGLSCTGLSGVSLTYVVVTAPSHGTLGAIDQATGSIAYTPRRGFSGTDTFTYRASDSGGASGIATVTITVPRETPRIASTMSWTIVSTKTYTSFRSLIAYDVPSAGKVHISCAGYGCSFRTRTVTAARRSCKAKRCTGKARAGARTVILTPVFRGTRLAVGTRLTMMIVAPGTIGKVYVFTMRPSRAPSAKTTCIAPGYSTPGQAC